MNPPVRDESVFTKPSVPKNSWQLLLWVIFEPILLQRYSETLSKKQTIVIFLRTYSWIVLISITLYFLGCFITVSFEIPTLFFGKYNTEFTSGYQLATSLKQQYFFVIQKTIVTLIMYIALALIVGFTKKLNTSLSGTFYLIIFTSFFIGLGITSYITLSICIYIGMMLWISSDTMRGIKNEREVIWGLIFGLAFALAFGFVYGLFLGFFWGITSVFICYFFYCHGYCYPIYLIRNLLNINFYTSPYHNDAVIWMPLWGVEKKMCRLAIETPEDALKFVRFLREYRPLQTKLADSIAHAACAGTWLNQPLAFEVLQPPLIENDKFKSSDLWLKQLEELKTQLRSFRHQSQVSLKQQYFQHFLKQLDDFNAQTQVENKRWRDDYLQALTLWKKVALEEQENLNQQATQLEPITTNVYLSGEALRPELNASVFLGRDDLKDELVRRIGSAGQMPTFLFHGQRRVGKTSLLYFLEPLLGSGFKVVFQELQDCRVSSVQAWLFELQERISRKLELSTENYSSGGDWLSAWLNFEKWLQSLNLNNHYKLILAFDEYEYLHNLLQADPEQGARLLAAMRSFSQRQNHIVFLFVGAALFTELENPPWGQYFVQAQSFRVDYLLPADAKRLITEPVSLIYPPELPEQMVALTQGHPALLQWLCSEMVNIANRTPKKNMTQADLDQVIAELIDNSSIAPMAVFWQQFCADTACKATVQEIINAHPPTDKKQLNRLREHGFIVQDDSGLWRLRVPLFERWLKAFDRVDLD